MAARPGDTITFGITNNANDILLLRRTSVNGGRWIDAPPIEIYPRQSYHFLSRATEANGLWLLFLAYMGYSESEFICTGFWGTSEKPTIYIHTTEQLRVKEWKPAGGPPNWFYTVIIEDA